MFVPSDSSVYSKMASTVEANYVIKPNDRLELQVYTQNGERIIDPEFELAENAQNIENLRPRLEYIVQKNGQVKLPMVGTLSLSNLTLNEAEQYLQKKYEEFYTQPFVNLRFINKRVIVLGNSTGQVVPLQDENTKVSEILALTQSIDNNAKSQEIRLIRNDEMFKVDFSTLEGYLQSDYIVQSGDILYVEPIRRPFNEFFRDNGPIISIVTSILSLIIVIISINAN
ncbi:MAG: polysaccharide biosynthesis/export family protein [Bacteroidota bacterium]